MIALSVAQRNSQTLCGYIEFERSLPGAVYSGMVWHSTHGKSLGSEGRLGSVSLTCLIAVIQSLTKQLKGARFYFGLSLCHDRESIEMRPIYLWLWEHVTIHISVGQETQVAITSRPQPPPMSLSGRPYLSKVLEQCSQQETCI